MEINNRPVSVIGAAKSGLAAAETLARLGARVLLSDIQSRERLQQLLHDANLPATVEIEAGGHSERVLAAEFIVLSPGVRPDIPILRQAADQGIPILSEIEIAFLLSQGKRLVVTGSNGKTTTTTLLAELCRAHFPEVFLGGNIGIPMMSFASQTTPASVQVLEVSSFQLETIQSFRPDIAIITNFFENHLDRYPSYAAYLAAKERIVCNMTDQHWLVLNAEQQAMCALAARVPCRVAWFGGSRQENAYGIFPADGILYYYTPTGDPAPIMPISSISLIGLHNQENVMAAVVTALLAGVPAHRIEAIVQNFVGVEHRLERVRTVNGITWINDSKGTNCAASIIALRACPEQSILIAGGRDKGTDLSDWVETIRTRCKGVVLFGEARTRFRAALEGFVAIKLAGNLEEAVAQAAAWATAGDTVVLSPACSSYDLFANFMERGARFKELVEALPETSPEA